MPSGFRKKSTIVSILLLLASFSLNAQFKELVDLGVVEGEFRNLKRTLLWTNDSDQDLVVRLRSDNKPALKFTLLETSVSAGDEVEIPIEIELQGEVGDMIYELKLLDGNDLLLHTFQLSLKVLQTELDVFKAYRNIHWPLRVKEEIFNMKTGYRGDTLKAVFNVYNLGGKPLELPRNELPDKFEVSLEPHRIEHNTFGQMTITLITDNNSELGFKKETLKVYEGSRLILGLPVQYTLIPKIIEREGARLTTNIVNHDFKVVRKGEKPEVVISLANNGNETLIIEKMEANCKCLSYNEIEEISSGESKKLRIVFDSNGRTGLEEKTIAIFSNDSVKPIQVLRFRAHVK